MCWDTAELCGNEKLVRNVGSNPSLLHKAVYTSVGQCNAHVCHCAEPFTMAVGTRSELLAH